MKTYEKWLVITGILVASTNLCAQEKEHTRIFDKAIKNYDWRTTQWSEDNTPYKRIRLYIDKFIQQGQKPDTLATRYKAMAQENPYDSLSQFRWAYAARKAALATYPFDRSKILAPLEAMDRTVKPRTYDWTRLRFLLELEMAHSKELIPVGDRLLRHDPRDRDVKYELVAVLNHSPAIEDRRKAVSYAQSLSRLDPRRASYRACLASAYMNLWRKTQTSADREHAITEYRAYLQLAPLREPFRKEAEFWLKELQRNTKSS